MKEYGAYPFGVSTLAAFRKRFSEEDMAALLEASVPKEDKKMIRMMETTRPAADAACCPADITYPQDIELLNQAREKAVRTAIRKQLQYISRDIGHAAKLAQNGVKRSTKQAERLNIVTTV